jgi:hypothetical protein
MIRERVSVQVVQCGVGSFEKRHNTPFALKIFGPYFLKRFHAASRIDDDVREFFDRWLHLQGGGEVSIEFAIQIIWADHGKQFPYLSPSLRPNGDEFSAHTYNSP